ncbi:MAG: hypothetical protein GY754_01885 [bacterium]|nr:hypothetical protein [bacterium]
MKLRNLFLALIIAILAVGTAFAQEPAPAVADEPEAKAEKKFVPYMQMRLWTGYQIQSKEAVSATATEGETDFHENLVAVARFGAKGSYGKLRGQVELAVKGPVDGYDVKTRHIYGAYDLGIGEFLVGVTEAPYKHYSSCAIGDNAGVGFGASWPNRVTQIKLTLFGAYIDLIQPKTTNTTSDSVTLGTSTNNMYPQIAAGYEFKNDFLSFGPGFAINMTELESADAYDGKTITSWIAYLHGKIDAGKMISINFNATYGMNTGNMGVLGVTVLPGGPDTTANKVMGNAAGDGFENTSVIEGFGEVMVKLSPIKILAGAAYVSASNDMYTSSDAKLGIYGQVDYQVMDGFNVIPGVMYIANMDSYAGVAQGSDIYAGIKFQMNLSAE